MTILAPHKQKYCYTMPLACLVGDANAASILSKIHHWIEHEAGRVFDGVRWIHNSYKDFVNEFPWMTVEQVRRFINAMKADGILRVERLTYRSDDIHSYWYSINYEVLEERLSQKHTPQPRKSRGRHSGKLTRGSVKLNTAPVKSDAGTSDFNNSTIYTNKSSKNTPIDNNNPEAAVTRRSEKEDKDLDLPEEGETITFCLPSDLSQDETDEIEEVDDPREDINVSSVRDNNNIWVLQAYGFELTRQLEKIAAKYSEKEIERSLEYLDESKESGQVIQKPLGWLTECLKNEWWHDSLKSREEAAVIEGLAKQGKFLNNPELFFAEFWQMVDEGFINPMPIDQWEMEGLLGSYLQFLDETFYVNWYDPDFQAKLDQNVFTTMALSEARKRFHEER